MPSREVCTARKAVRNWGAVTTDMDPLQVIKISDEPRY